MAYDEQLAERVNRVLAAQEGVVQKKMFGGLAFMVNGNMSVGIDHDQLMVRVGPEGYAFGLDDAPLPAHGHHWKAHEGIHHRRSGGYLQRRGAGELGGCGGCFCAESACQVI